MLLGLFILIITIIGFFVPKRQQKKYYIAIAFLLGVILMFYNPPETDDLYRYYKMFDIVKNKSFSDCISLNFGVSDWYYKYMLSDLMQNSRIFMLIIFIISRTGIRQLVPFFFCICTYVPLFILVDKISHKYEYRKIACNIGYMLVLFCIDFRFVTCLRNLMAYSIFALLLYDDMNTNSKKRKVLIFIGYVLLCEIHMSCTVLLVIRLLILIFKNKLKNYICIAFLFLGTFINLIVFVLQNYLGGFSYTVRLAQRITDYYIGRTEYNINGAVFFIVSILIELIIVFFCYRIERKKIDQKYCSNANYFYYVTFFTLGSINQYDVLTRNVEIISILLLPYIMSFYNECVFAKKGCICIISSNKAAFYRFVVFALSILLLISSLLFYTNFSYVPMQKGF